jgi:hypothetical protein
VNRRVASRWVVQSHTQIHIRRLNRRTKSKKFCPYHTPALAPAAAQQKYKSLAARIHTHIYTYKSASLRHSKPKDRAAPSRLVSSRLTSLFDSAATSPGNQRPCAGQPQLAMPAVASSGSMSRSPPCTLSPSTASGANEPVQHDVTETEMETKTHPYSSFFASGNPEPTPSGPSIFLNN